jgi:pantothenate kinase-related protein Tda10
MSTETKSLAQRLKEHLESPAGQKSMEDYFNKIAEKNRIQLERANKLLQRYGVCDDSTFDYLMLDILEKQEKYDKRHYSTYTDRSLHIMNLMWEIASLKGVEIEPIDGLTENFPSMVYDYYGYQFAITHGQGSVLSVYRQNELRYRS